MAFLDFIPLIGDIAEGIFGASAQKSANRTNIKLQREQQGWEAEMSNTAMQRRVKDLTAAGLNPVLAAGGQGASTPSVSPATVETAYKPTGRLGPDIQSAMMLKTQRDLMTAQTNAANAGAADAGESARTRKIANDLADGTSKGGDDAPGYAGREREQTYIRSLQANMEGAQKISIAREEALIKQAERVYLDMTLGARVTSAKQAAAIGEQEIDIRTAEKIIKQLQIPEAKAMAKWFDSVGAASPAAKAAMTITQWIKFIIGR